MVPPRSSVRPPTASRRLPACGHALHGDDPDPLVHQVAEIPRIEPIVDEYRLHRLVARSAARRPAAPCPGCSHRQLRPLSPGGPGHAGRGLPPQQAADPATDRRPVRAVDLHRHDLQAGAAAAAVLESPVQRVGRRGHQAAAVNVDETSWRQERRRLALGDGDRDDDRLHDRPQPSAEVAKAVLGTRDGPDRQRATGSAPTSGSRAEAPGLLDSSPPRFPGDDRSRRGGRADRPAVASAVGPTVPLVAPPERREVDRTPSWAMTRLAAEVKAALEDGTRAPARRRRRRAPRSCGWRRACGPSCGFAGVEPTNNAAERAVRHAVIWRRISGGTDSAWGSRFVERMLTVVATCRQQGRNVLEYLTSCFQAARSRQAIPSLLPVTEPAIKVA